MTCGLLLMIVDGEEKGDVPSYVCVEMVVEPRGSEADGCAWGRLLQTRGLCSSAACSTELILV